MTTFNGLPAHVLLVHFIVILSPLTAVLAISVPCGRLLDSGWSGWCSGWR